MPGAGFDSSPLAAAIVPPAGTITGSGPAIAIDRAQNNAFRAVNAAWTAGARVRVDAARTFRHHRHGGRTCAATGRVARASRPRRLPRPAPSCAQADASACISRGTPAWTPGWTQWLLENYGFEFSAVRPADVKAGALRQRFDVLIIGDENARSLLDGFQAERRARRRIQGGMGTDGVQALDQFVKDGGTLVCMNGSSNFAIAQLKLPVKNVAADVRRAQFFASGSLLQVTTDAAHPLMAGMPERAAVFFDGSPVFQPLEGFTGDVLAKYQAQGSPLLSGYLLGEKTLQGQAAALDVHLGTGHVVLIGFRPQWRGQPFGTFRVLFNAALYHGAVAAAAKGTPGFWAAASSAVGR